MTVTDLRTDDGLFQAYINSDCSWAELERISGIPASTLKTRYDRFRRGERAEIVRWESDDEDAEGGEST